MGKHVLQILRDDLKISKYCYVLTHIVDSQSLWKRKLSCPSFNTSTLKLKYNIIEALGLFLPSISHSQRDFTGYFIPTPSAIVPLVPFSKVLPPHLAYVSSINDNIHNTNKNHSCRNAIKMAAKFPQKTALVQLCNVISTNGLDFFWRQNSYPILSSANLSVIYPQTIHTFFAPVTWLSVANERSYTQINFGPNLNRRKPHKVYQFGNLKQTYLSFELTPKLCIQSRRVIFTAKNIAKITSCYQMTDSHVMSAL